MRAALAFAAACLLAVLPGCQCVAPITVKDATTYTVVSLAYATRATYELCIKTGLEAEKADRWDDVEPAMITCEAAVAGAVPALKALAKAGDANRANLQTLCQAARVAAALDATLDALAGVGARVPVEARRAVALVRTSTEGLCGS